MSCKYLTYLDLAINNKTIYIENINSNS